MVSTYSASSACDILLIDPPYNRRLGSGVVPPIGLGYIVSYLRNNGFVSHVLDCSLYFDDLSDSTLERMRNWLRRELGLHRPRFAIGIGPCTTPTVRSTRAIAETCRQMYPNIPEIFGGPLATIPEQEWVFFKKFGATAIVKGDAEIPLRDILVSLRRGESLSEIRGVQISETCKTENFFVKDLNGLPYPAWDVFDLTKYKPSVRRDLFANPFAPIVGSRGCPFSCGFCISGQHIEYRRRSFEKTVNEVEYLRNTFGIRSLIFYDDALFADMKRVNEDMRFFAALINEEAPGVLWQIEIRPDLFSAISDDTIQYIFTHGCRQMNIGVEKASKNQLDAINKPYSTRDLKDACKSVSRVCPEMRLAGTFILGGPKETARSIRETIKFSKELNLLYAHFYPLELYPGTPIYSSVFGQDQTIWYHKVVNDRWQWGEIIYEDESISAAQLIDFVHLAYSQFYERKEWKERAKRILGDNYEKIWSVARLWKKDRFRLGGKS